MSELIDIYFSFSLSLLLCQVIGYVVCIRYLLIARETHPLMSV